MWETEWGQRPHEEIGLISDWQKDSFEFFGSASDVQTILGKTWANIEMMVHPQRDASGALADLDDIDLKQKIRSLDIQDRIGKL